MKNKKKKLLLSTTLGTAILSKVSNVFAAIQPAYGIEMPEQLIERPIYETILLVIGKILYYVLVPILLIIGCFKYIKNTKESKIAKVITCILSVVLCGLVIFLQVKISEEGYFYYYQILYIAITICYIIGSIVYLIKKGIEKLLNVIIMPVAILIIMIGIKYLKIYMLPILILIAIIMIVIIHLNRNKK